VVATTVETKTVPISGEERLLLTGISWDFYLRFCDELEGRRIRLTYDRGDMEIMITKRPHEFYKKLLAKLVEQLVLELNIPVSSGGSMTFQRADLQRGIEPDECWWIAHESQLRGVREFDAQRDPPPDLAVEIEITSSLVKRVGIYAALRVPEIWRFNGTTLQFSALQEDGSYQSSEYSLAFPFLKPEHLTPFLQIDAKKDETTRLREFVSWLRDQGFAP
jgi:Uma2 family endonuclease